MSVDPSPEELEDVTLCAQRLWDLDENRLECTKDYVLNVGVRAGRAISPKFLEGRLIQIGASMRPMQGSTHLERSCGGAAGPDGGGDQAVGAGSRRWANPAPPLFPLHDLTRRARRATRQLMSPPRSCSRP